MSDDEKQPFLDQAAILKQEYELKKQNMGSVVQDDGPPPVKRGRGRPKGSKNKKTMYHSPPSSPKPQETKESTEEEQIVKVSEVLL